MTTQRPANTSAPIRLVFRIAHHQRSQLETPTRVISPLCVVWAVCTRRAARTTVRPQLRGNRVLGAWFRMTLGLGAHLFST